MTTNYIHPQFSEVELENLKNEFNQLQTINQKYNFWKDKFNISYALWGRVLINGYSNNFEIIPKNEIETQDLINTILEDALPLFSKRNDIPIKGMKEQFVKAIEISPNKAAIVDYEVRKIESLVLPKRQTPIIEPDKYERDLYFVRGFENYLFQKREFEDYQNIIAGYLLTEYYKGIQLAKYREFVECYLRKEKSNLKIKLTGEQKVLALIYLRFGDNTTTAVQKADLFEYFIDNFKSKSIQKIFNSTSDYENEKNLDVLIDFFRSLKLNSIARELDDKLDKLKQKRQRK